MHMIQNIFVVHTNKKIQEKAASDTAFQDFKTGCDPIGYLTILKNFFFLNQSEQQPIQSLCLATRRMYNTMNYTNENKTNYLFIFKNAHEVNEACNGSIISRRVQEHGMKILYPLHVTGFDTLLDGDKKETDTAR